MSNIQPLLFISILDIFYLSSKLFINLCNVIKSSFFSLLVLSVTFILIFAHICITPSKSGTILVVIFCISAFFFFGNHIASAYSSFGLIIVVIIFFILILEVKSHPSWMCHQIFYPYVSRVITCLVLPCPNLILEEVCTQTSFKEKI